MNSYLGLLLLAASSVWAATPQFQPASYNKSQPVSRETFEDFEGKHLHLNQAIPQASEARIRVATYNVHYLRDLHDTKSNVQGVLADVRAMDATAILFQEVLGSPEDASRAAFERGLDSLGYIYRFFARPPGAFLGNMIASRHPLHNTAAVDLGSRRVLAEAQLRLANGKALTLMCTHWDHKSPAVRLGQSQRLVAHIRAKGHTDYVLGADLNARHQSPAVQNLVTSGPMKTSFSALQWPHPDYTCWAGWAIDFLLVGPAVERSVLGTYVHHTLSSDHLPVLMDLSLQADARAPAPRGSSTGTGTSQPGDSSVGLYILFGFILVGAIACALYLAFIRKPAGHPETAV